MIEREITPRLTGLFEQYPFVTVTGPRQSGKTTLCRAAFPDLDYANLEAPDQREFAESDPRGFLAHFRSGAIIDEIQHVPMLMSYLQVLADEWGGNGLFVLTGSEQFRLSDSISQSLAGRTALLRLLPFSLAERERAGASPEVDDILYSGFYPRIHDQQLDPRQALGDYFETYVERDVRRLGDIRNLSGFRRFVRLCAGRVGQLLNLSSLGSDAGVSHTTARSWLTILERSYIIFQLRPHHTNLRKRLVKSPKLYFYDVGLASYLIGMDRVEHVATHPLRGPLFENAVVIEALKHRLNRGRQENLSFFRDSKGLECDLLYETGRGVTALEVKAGATISSDFFGPLHRVANVVPGVSSKIVVYGGQTRQSRSDCEVVPIGALSGVLRRLEVDQRLISFLQDNKSAAPNSVDTAILETIYSAHIHPILTGLESNTTLIAKELFHSLQPEFTVKLGSHSTQYGGFCSEGTWERAKGNYILKPGFGLSKDEPLQISHRYRFVKYTGIGNSGFSIHLVVQWRLSSDTFFRQVTLDDTSIPHLNTCLRYSELEARGSDIDRVVADVSESVLDRIEALARR